MFERKEIFLLHGLKEQNTSDDYLEPDPKKNTHFLIIYKYSALHFMKAPMYSSIYFHFVHVTFSPFFQIIIVYEYDVLMQSATYAYLQHRIRNYFVIIYILLR